MVTILTVECLCSQQDEERENYVEEVEHELMQERKGIVSVSPTDGAACWNVKVTIAFKVAMKSDCVNGRS